MGPKEIARINELARKQKCGELTPGEKDEQASLRERFLSETRENTKAALDSVLIRQPDGTLKPLKEKSTDGKGQ